MRAAAIVAAAGRGLRMGAEINKQYLRLAGRPVLFYTLAACMAARCFAEIVVVVTPGEEEIFRREVLLPYFPRQEFIVTHGGRERQESVYRGLLEVSTGCDVVCVHDGARPLAGPELLVRAVEAARESGAAVTAVPVKDTIKIVSDTGLVLTTPPRRSLRIAQTPQAFRREWLFEAYKRACTQGCTFTDEASLLEYCGYQVRVVEGNYDNLKITTPEDLVLAEILLGRRLDAYWHRL